MATRRNAAKKGAAKKASKTNSKATKKAPARKQAPRKSFGEDDTEVQTGSMYPKIITEKNGFTFKLGEETDFRPDFAGIVLGHHPRAVYYSIPMEESGGGQPPDCQSLDLVTGSTFGECAQCRFKYRNAQRAGIKPCCKERHILYVWFPEDDAVLGEQLWMLDLSQQSVSPWGAYVKEQRAEGYTHPGDVWTFFSTEQAKGGGGQIFGKAVFEMGEQHDLFDELAPEVQRISNLIVAERKALPVGDTNAVIEGEYEQIPEKF